MNRLFLNVEMDQTDTTLIQETILSNQSNQSEKNSINTMKRRSFFKQAFAVLVSSQYVLSNVDIEKSIISVKNFGAIGDGITDDTGAIQKAIDYVAALNHDYNISGGKVFVPAGVYIVSKTITLKNGIILEGETHKSSIIKKHSPDGKYWIIESEDFEKLSGSNAWFTKEGVPTAFGLKNIRIDGNAYPPKNDSFGAVRFYGKRFVIDNLYIHNVNGIGLLTECGQQVGQFSTTDMPETSIGTIWIRRTGSHGWKNSGPHDQGIGAVYISSAGFAGFGHGIYIIEEKGKYAMSGEIKKAHVYDCKGDGVFIDGKASPRFNILISESNNANGLTIKNGDNININWLQLYRNNRLLKGTQLDISEKSSFININSINLTGTNTASDAIRCSGKNINISNLNIKDNSILNQETAIKLKNAKYCNFSGIIEGFYRTIKLKNSKYCKFDLIVNNPKKELIYISKEGTSYNSFRITGESKNDINIFSGTKPSALAYDTRKTNSFNINFKNKDTLKRSKYISKGKLIDMTQQGEQLIKFKHNLIYTPDYRNCILNLSYFDQEQNRYLGIPRVINIDSENIYVKVNVKEVSFNMKIQPRIYCKAFLS